MKEFGLRKLGLVLVRYYRAAARGALRIQGCEDWNIIR